MKTVWTLSDLRACWLEAHAVKMSYILILESQASTVLQQMKGSIMALNLAQVNCELPSTVSASAAAMLPCSSSFRQPNT